MTLLWHLLLQSRFALNTFRTLFLAFAAVITEERLSTSSCRLESLTKCDGTFCVNIRVIQEFLWREVKFLPGILCAQNPSFHCNYVHVMFITIATTPMMFLGSPLPLSTIGMGTATLCPTSDTFKSMRSFSCG